MNNSAESIGESRKTLASHVHEQIRGAILAGQLKPGERIDQIQLAETLRVSIVPIREALKALEAEGLVTLLARRGAFVTEISLADLDELYYARQLIEGTAIFHAVPRLAEPDFQTAEQLIARMKHATQANDIPAYIRLNREFHLSLYNVLNNQPLRQVILNLWERSELYRYRYMYITHDTEAVHREHIGIIEACRQCDPELARARAVAHIGHAQSGLHAYVEQESAAGRH